jgi:hypothetical protein
MKCTDKKIIESINSSKTMAEAAAKTGLHYNTFKRRAVNLNVWEPNQGGKGTSKPKTSGKFMLQDILEGKHPQYQTNKLKKRLVKEGIIEYNCSMCKIKEWNGKILVLELDHIDGNRTNHSVNNLRLLCPNCHSQTDTFRGKNV